MAAIYTLGKKERLKSRKAIEELFRKGQRLNEGPFRVTWKRSDVPGVRLGVGVSNRLFKKATDRNRIKRLMREAFRLNKLPLSEVVKNKGTGLDLFLGYNLNVLPDYQQTEAAVKNILIKIIKRVNEDNSSNTKSSVSAAD